MEAVRQSRPIRHTDLPARDPRIGEMVRVRTRRWLVAEVTEPASSIGLLLRASPPRLDGGR